MAERRLDLFGGDAPWSSDAWTASDDRVRGGKSRSYLDCPSTSKAVFHGDLDITALGGAGFASQRTVNGTPWDLDAYDGLLLKTGKGDGKKYTLTLKDETLPKRPDGREQSTVSWEFDFATHGEERFIPWDEFKPTYRGKPKPDARPLDLKNVQRVSIMMRSFFGDQQGPFRLEIESIAAALEPTKQPRASHQTSGTDSTAGYPEKIADSAPKSTWLSWFCGMFRT
ncbi:hypothetical protein JX265_000994 [Neoarthrinium moseri]|uniref:NADH:ubiquinone oxidoreductase intermediate-associated protein 30 domain-containing protein n=1 Tax=Neoarthrinium moseri TaxID=1658444 RepID=A0A9P9WWU5_9PEZI|nr:uncharacterized protein JN550_004733 [Neoarthrinium moseri]KAI1846071.1 hypothetical protein JX266_007880 [Neoarthrinium moseri]KAI1871288.1 hypothetical protein JN550_004733 [Neoarthrinium moseri]KAI1880754.1 hypothetical protein JX265_000994 [Neoarthrinium moseri]